ncbi:MAG: glycosyltransferase family 4 protein [Rikenellaceae bacterium]
MQSYKELLEHYEQMLALFDVVHFNSENTREVYQRFVEVASSEVIPITHRNILDRRVPRSYSGDCLRLIFIGALSPYKGFARLMEALCALDCEGYRSWSLSVWGARGSSGDSRVTFNGGFNHTQLFDIFRDDSLLVAPSLWNETFSLVTLEALSFATPVLTSSTVGAKDIVAEYDSWFIFNDTQNLTDKLRALMQNADRLRRFNYKIMNQAWRHNLQQHAQAIDEMYSGAHDKDSKR